MAVKFNLSPQDLKITDPKTNHNTPIMTSDTNKELRSG